MKFIPYITFFLLFIAFLGFFFLHIFNKRREKITRIAIQELLKKNLHQFEEMYFFSATVHRIVLFLMLSVGKRAKDALFFLCHGKKYDEIREYLLQYGRKYLAATLSAFTNLDLAEEMLKSIRQSDKMLVQLAYINILKDKKEDAKDILNLIKAEKLSGAERGLYRYCMAKLALDIGDLFNAANDATMAIKLFHKSKSFYEEAKSYILLGEIYRVSAVSDMAYFMYNEAKKIADNHHNEALKADVLGNMGMLFTLQERFDAAEDVFSEALEINKKIIRDKACACVYNQLALLKLLDEKYEEAIAFINQALRYALTDVNAFSFELMAKVNFARKEYESAIKNADIAQKKYWKSNNLAAFFESKYLEAQAWFNLEEYEEAEAKIRHLLSVADENESSFHLANAYSLLGAIFMKRKKPARAKPFFEEAIRHELRNNRTEGMISDYLNLGIIAQKQGDNEGALINFREAKRYAQEVQNQDLENIIEKYINDLK